MDFLDALISPPRADHILVVRYIIIGVSLIFVPYISVLFGSTLFSLGFSVRGQRERNPLFLQLSEDLADMFLGRISVAFLLAVLPVITIGICFSQLLYGTGMKMTQYFFIITILTLLGVIFSEIFKRSFAKRETSPFMHYLFGLLTLGALQGAIFGYVSTLGVLIYPENWQYLTGLFPLPVEWGMIAQLNQFMTLALAFTGVAIVFFLLKWMGGLEDRSPEYRDYVRKFGGGVALGFTIVQALMMLWNLSMLPNIAKSHSVYRIALLALLAGLAVSYYLYLLLRDKKDSYSSRAFVFSLALFLIVFVDENSARNNSMIYQNYALESIALENEIELENARAALSGAVASIELGEEIFNAKCVACHRFDQKIVGPAYVDVLPKYEGDIEKLKGFISNPVKVNPDFIQMPNQGLKPHEAESAAMFLLQKYEEFKQQQK